MNDWYDITPGGTGPLDPGKRWLKGQAEFDAWMQCGGGSMTLPMAPTTRWWERQWRRLLIRLGLRLDPAVRLTYVDGGNQYVLYFPVGVIVDEVAA